MPVTKIIERVTLGELASDPSCTTPARAQLLIRQHAPPQGRDDAGGDLGTFTQASISATAQELPGSRAQVSWTVPATKLLKGKGYSFSLYWNSTGCRYARWTTWPHKHPTVDGGWKRCSGGAPAKTNTGDPILRRMWHTAGASDRDPACTSDWSWAFDPSMPEGWLMTSTSPPAVVTGTYMTQPSDSQVCGAEPAAAGARVVRWRFTPTNALYTDYVCMWSQYEPLDQTTAAGWYYGAPWNRDGTGAPRDTYLKLETIDYSALLRKHGPQLLFDRDDNYRADSPATMADSPNTWLNYTDGSVGGPAPGLSYLGPNYPGCQSCLPAASDEFLDVGPDGSDAMIETYGYMRQQYPGFSNRGYGSVTHDEAGNVILQYWLFYFYQEVTDPAWWTEHEGDWELVEVRLGPNLQPDRAFYAQHGSGGDTCEWSQVGHSFSADRPDVYVAQTSHASYFNSDADGALGPDIADGDGDGLLPEISEIRATDPSWVAWPGHWGGTGDGADSPRGPANQTQWSDRESWADGLGDPCA